MIIAIHQPNYAPWLGYFAKIAQADALVFLDDVQFSKNSYINRVQIDVGQEARWLTVPVRFRFGDPINRVVSADENWTKAHLDKLRQAYGRSAAFGEIWPWLDDFYRSLNQGDLAATNAKFIVATAGRLGLKCQFSFSSENDVGLLRGQERLVALVHGFGPDVTYLSGKGGDQYQTAEGFEIAGIRLAYTTFSSRAYDQGHEKFLPGLSVLDTLFHLGFSGTAGLLANSV